MYGKYDEPLKSAIIHEAEQVQYARGDDHHLIILLKNNTFSSEMRIYDDSDGIIYIDNSNGKTIQKFEAVVSAPR
jgi:hypothetical protein